MSAINAAAKASVAAGPRLTKTPQFQQVRGIKTIDFAGVKEDVYERDDWPKEKLLVSQKSSQFPTILASN